MPRDDGPRLRVPPLLQAAAVALAMHLAAAAAPSWQVANPWRGAVAVVLAAAGAAVALAGVVAFRRAGTTVDPRTPQKASALVVGGIYRVSRNPMYLGFALMLGGWAAWLSHPLALALLPAFVVAVDRLQIAPEERALAQRFGAAFDAYRRSVRRWL